jgi:RND superfamily putative drug exporter
MRTELEPKLGIFYRLGHLVVRRRWSFLVGYLVSMVFFGIFGVQIFAGTQSEGFSDPQSDSSQVEVILAEEFGIKESFAVLAIETPTNVNADIAAANELLNEIKNLEGVESITSYWSTGGAPTLLGKDGRTGLAIIFAEEGIEEEDLSEKIVTEFSGEQNELIVYPFGGEIIGSEFQKTITGDLIRAEKIAIPITVVILLFVFGSVVAAGLPFLVAGGTILGSFLVLFLISQVTDVSVFALNLITGLGLALGIDYALLIINRFREELNSGKDVPLAVVSTVNSAGKTVFVSGITVAVALASLLLFPQYFLRSFAYAGISVALLAITGALIAIPALLAILGKNVNRFKVRRGNLAPRDDGGWATLARFVMRRPWLVLISSVTLLLALAAPALNTVLGEIDERALPADNPIVQAGEVFRDRFPGYELSPYEIILINPKSEEEIQEYALQLSKLPEIIRVTTPSSIIVDGVVVDQNLDSASYLTSSKSRIEAIADVRPIDPAGKALVAELRSLTGPADRTLIGGTAAQSADSINSILDRVWIVAIWLALTTLIILFLYTGSILIPIKAFVLNIMSLGAMLGVLVWVFQGGNLNWLTGDYIVTGSVDLSTIVLIAVIAFALSMDYEVFMLSRIKEEHEAGAETADAVAFGLQRTGRIITAAALLIAIVFAAFLTSSATNIKQLGFGVALAILLDATVVRGLLVPAFMRIAGRANWWAPEPLRKLYSRIGLREG